MMRSFLFSALLVLTAASAQAQDVQPTSPAPTPPPIIFQSGTGSDSPSTTTPMPQVRMAPPPRQQIACSALPDAQARIGTRFYPSSDDAVAVPNAHLLIDKALFDRALESYIAHHCRHGSSNAYGPAQIIIIDYAKPSTRPRLYAVDLLSGQGLDTPVPVAHGVGSDRDDDGIAESFSNVYNSLASSLGAARGAELYHGANGLSLRLDGLDPSNSQMRVRDIVAHSYQPERRRYFNASYVSVREGKPGTSEGCIVVAPHLRDWLFGILRDGGFLFVGLGGARANEMPSPFVRTEAPVGDIQFVPGTGG